MAKQNEKKLQRVEMALKIKRAHKAKKFFLTEDGHKWIDRVAGIKK
jgi:hypothetical protein